MADSAGTRRLRADGERSRQAILTAAARLASVEGLDGLSIGRLADQVGMSKSGLFAHFGSKEELQLATVEVAGAIISEEIVVPAFEQPEGVRRLRALCESFLSYVERKVFPGGCFFAAAAAELDAKSGPVKEAVAESYREWFGLLEESARKAQELGELDPGFDPAQLAFELVGMLEAANTFHQLFDDAGLLERARGGIRARLHELSP